MGKTSTRHHRAGPLDVEVLRSGVLLSAHANPRHLPLGADPLPVGVPSDVGVANAEGNAEVFARQNHVHNHPAGLGFSLHHSHYARTWQTRFQIGTPVALVAGRVYMTPIQIPWTMTVDRVFVWYTTPVAGNMRAGIYADNGGTPVGGALQVESASIVKSGTWRQQEFTIVATQLTPGLYWLPVVSDEATTKAYPSGLEAIGGTLLDYFYDFAYGPLTNPCPASADALGAGIGKGVRVSSSP